MPFNGRVMLLDLGEELRRLDERVKQFDAQIVAISQTESACQRLQAIPGIGPLTTTALVAAVAGMRRSSVMVGNSVPGLAWYQGSIRREGAAATRHQ